MGWNNLGPPTVMKVMGPVATDVEPNEVLSGQCTNAGLEPRLVETFSIRLHQGVKLGAVLVDRTLQLITPFIIVHRT
jgi:hypothetical protein